VTPEETTAAVVDALNDVQIPYMLVGSLASTYYGTARITQDADFVVQLSAGMMSRLMTRLGPRFRLNPQTTFETATATRRYVVELADKSYLVEFFLLSEDAHDTERFARRRQVRMLDRDVFLPTVEDAIITKIRWFHACRRPKDIQDARGMIAVQGDRIDWAYVYSWCDRHGTRELLEGVRQSLPPDLNT
jgi:hypothetical protein